MDKANTDILDTYWGLIKTLNSSMRAILLERLQNSQEKAETQKRNARQRAFDSWQSHESAEELIQQLRNSRSTNRELESL